MTINVWEKSFAERSRMQLSGTVATSNNKKFLNLLTNYSNLTALDFERKNLEKKYKGYLDNPLKIYPLQHAVLDA